MKLRTLLWWILANVTGWTLGGFTGVALAKPGEIIVAGFMGVALGGIAAGVLQWLVLRRQVANVGWWLLANVAAVIVVGGVVFAVGAVNDDFGWVVGVGIFGTVVGVLQWLVFRQKVDRAGWWVLASTVGWVIAGPISGFGGWAVLGAVYGVVTGLVLVDLLP